MFTCIKGKVWLAEQSVSFCCTLNCLSYCYGKFPNTSWPIKIAHSTALSYKYAVVRYGLTTVALIDVVIMHIKMYVDSIAVSRLFRFGFHIRNTACVLSVLSKALETNAINDLYYTQLGLHFVASWGTICVENSWNHFHCMVIRSNTVSTQTQVGTNRWQRLQEEIRSSSL